MAERWVNPLTNRAGGLVAGVLGSRRRRLALGGLLVVAIGATVAGVLAGSGDPSSPMRRRALSPAAADDRARTACVLTAQLIEQVSANASAASVLRLADRARAAADDAAYAAPQWVSLDGAVQALARSLHANDASLAQVGMEQITAACAPTGVTVR
jgi:hypothetical protein